MISLFREFMRLESSSGILLLVAAILAMLTENSPLNSYYDALLGTPVEIRIGDLVIAKPFLLWINDGLMAVFFFLIGLELKREILEGDLSDPTRVALPAFAALGGMAVPALFYVYFNIDDTVALRGWAVPSATDIAFALAVLSLLGRRVPNTLKLFLLTLAIVDDLGAILIIALFYTSDLSWGSLSIAAVALLSLSIMNRNRVARIAPYLLIGVVMWAAVLKSGVHATLAGVLLALFIPLRLKGKSGESPLRQLEHDLHPTVAFGILPLFAFANTGVPLNNLGWDILFQPVPLGIALGLFLGNQIGVMGVSWLAIKLRFAQLPAGVGWAEMYGVSMLCGIGFTMSLFISSLAFEQGGPDFAVDSRIGILSGSLLSAICGYLWLNWRLPSRPN
ncbi:MAG: Na+/H+ antiporter NhaA [Gammaproteobacteria bacterium]|nr:Na+/H+ antiporter NhaA [Gammaproteobacteria bacterium]